MERALHEERPRIAVLMGVAGSGKTTVGRALAHRLGWRFQEGDALHPPENVAKMRAGHPLDDEDRAPWLAAVVRGCDWSTSRGRGSCWPSGWRRGAAISCRPACSTANWRPLSRRHRM